MSAHSQLCRCYQANCACNSRQNSQCACLETPRCVSCGGMFTSDESPPSNSSVIFLGIPRTTARIYSEGGLWGTGSAVYTHKNSPYAPQGTSQAFLHLPVMVNRCTDDTMLSALGATALPTVPLGAIMRHNTNIIHAEAALNHAPQPRSQTVTDDNRSYMEVLDARERRLISSSSQHSYVFTPGNTPATGNTPANTPDHSPAHKHRTRPADSFDHDNNNCDDLSYTPHLRGGGGKATRKTKKKLKKSPWDNNNLMVEDSSFLYEFENRSKLRALLAYPDLIAETPLNDLPDNFVHLAVETFRNDGQCRFNDPEFVIEAEGASDRRLNGDFNEYEALQFSENWINDDSSEEYQLEDVGMNFTDCATLGHDDLPKEDSRPSIVQKSSAIGGFDGSSDEIPRHGSMQKRPSMDNYAEDSDDEAYAQSTRRRGDSVPSSFRPSRDDDDHTDDGQGNCLKNGGKFFNSSNASGSSQTNDSNNTDPKFLPANQNMLATTTSDIKFEALRDVKTRPNGANIIPCGDILRYTLQDSAGQGENKATSFITKDILLYGETPPGENKRSSKGSIIMIPPGQHAHSEPHLRADFVFPCNDAPAVIYGTKEMSKALALVDPRFKNEVNLSWKRARLVRAGKDFVSLWDLRQAFHFYQNEADFISQLEFGTNRARRLSQAQTASGFAMVCSSGLYRKVKTVEYHLFNDELIIDLGLPLNKILSDLADPGYTIVMYDMRTAHIDGIMPPHGVGLEEAVRLGPNCFPTKFLRDLAGSAGPYSKSHAHIAPVGLGWAKPGHADPDGVRMSSREKQCVVEFHKTHITRKIKQLPVPINRARKLHCGNGSYQLRMDLIGIWITDVWRPYINEGIPTCVVNGQNGKSHPTVSSIPQLKNVGRNITSKYNTEHAPEQIFLGNIPVWSGTSFLSESPGVSGDVLASQSNKSPSVLDYPFGSQLAISQDVARSVAYDANLPATPRTLYISPHTTIQPTQPSSSTHSIPTPSVILLRSLAVRPTPLQPFLSIDETDASSYPMDQFLPQRYPSPPQNTFPGNTFHERPIATVKPSGLIPAYSDKAQLFRQAALKGTSLDPNFDRHSADIEIGNTLAYQLIQKNLAQDSTHLDQQSPKKRVTFTDNCIVDVTDPSLLLLSKRGRGSLP